MTGYFLPSQAVEVKRDNKDYKGLLMKALTLNMSMVLSLCINCNLILCTQLNTTWKNKRGKVRELIILNSCSSLTISINQLIT